MNRLKQVANSLQNPARPELVPSGYEKRCGLLHSEWAYEHLRWMIQKDSLGQDIFLLGSHSPLRRWLAFRFCEVLGRECEFLALTPDTSEVDLKSRRELRAVDGLQGALEVVWFDQAVVRAALFGRVLVLEGLEKAERNVLPVLNNLLENREMQLEDGRFLVAPQRYDRLVKEGKDAGQLNLVRVHEDFRVVALGVPSPPFPGNPLDPPLRSRFQARHVARAPADLLLQRLHSEAPKAPAEVLQQLLKFYETLWELMQAQGSTSGMEVRSMAFSAPCYPSEESVISAAKLLNQLPQLPLHAVIQRIFPFQMESGLLNSAMAKLVTTILPTEGEEKMDIMGVVPASPGNVRVQLRCGEALTEVRCQGGDGECSVDSRLPAFQMQLLSEMVAAASTGQDLCIIGPRGEGKTFLAQHLARCLGYSQIHTLFLHEEMTARDLFQRRTTNEKGESIWEPSPLLRAMEHGGLCVLDGLQQLRPMTLSALAPLIQDREVTLYDGVRFISAWRWQHLQGAASMAMAELRRRGTRMTHPSFRMVALATPARAKGWLTNEVLQLFHFFVLPRNVDLQPVLWRSVPLCPKDLVQRLLQLRNELLEASLDARSPLWTGQNPLDTQGAIHPIVTLSLRSLLRAARVATGNTTQDVADYLQSALMMDFMPPNESGALVKILQSAGFSLRSRLVRLREAAGMAIVPAAPGEMLRIGAVQLKVLAPKESALIPETEFFDNPQQTLSLHDMLRDMAAQEHLLLMGNQGVGKNKLIDRLLMLLHREREYIQLHRDTTVGSLTLVPTLRNGVVSFDDSPLVKAMLHGRVLVIDEFDKAPTEVVLTLKGLLQDGEILLVDGRRFVKCVAASMDASPIHPNFQVVALANRPGYPFLGNDFFREMGDCFACHAIQNPDEESEVAMLQSYAPDVSLELLHLLSSSFTELRALVEAGKLSYPYSTRELVNLVRHLQQFPEDSLAEVMENVFAFDVYDPELRRLVLEVFQRHGLALDPVNPVDPARGRGLRPRQLLQLLAPRICGQLRRGEGAPEPVTVKSCSLQRQWRRRWRGVADQPGDAGAEWQPLELHSARARRFSEEELWFRMGSVTKDGVLIRGQNPLTGSWLGNLLSMAAAESTLCVLSSQMILDVYDLKTKQCRQLPLAANGHRALHGVTANNTAMVALPGEGCLCAYDARQGSLLRIWPRSGEAEAFQLTLASHGAVKLQPWHGELLIYAEGGQELVVADMEGAAARLEVHLTGGLRSVDVLSDCRLMLSSSTERLELTWPGNSTGRMDVKVVSVTLDVDPHFVSHPLPASQLQLPDHLQSSMGGHSHGHVMSDGSIGSSGRHGLLSLGLDLGMASTPIWEYPRREALLAYLRSQMEAEDFALEVDVALVSCWHSASNSLISVFSPVGDSPLRARYGMLYLEALNVSSSMLRRVLLGKVPGLGSQSQAQPGPGTDSSLADQGLLLTRRKVPDRVQHVEMPQCLAVCELEDGRLALLFADSHVRILELRADSLALQEALYSSMLGRPGKEDPEMVEENLEFDELEEGEDDLEDFEDDGQDDDSTNDGAGASGGRGSGRRGKGGRGGRGRKGQGGRGSGKGSGKSDAKRAEAEKVIKEARERAAEVRKIQKMKLELKDFDHAKYDELFKVVEKEIMQLRVILQSIEARERERTWLRGKVLGEFDDNKIVDLAIGEKNVFKRRGQREDHSFLQALPKRLSFVVDVSGSMAVFNGDGRLDRLMATMVMMMESLVGLEHKYIYEIIGHSGESDWLPFVKMGEAPKDRVERYAVIEAMTDHAATARSGDNTLSAGVKAVQEIVKHEADDFFVFLVSDANLRGYGISPQDLAMALTGEERVNAHAIFIAEPEVAEEMTQCMPAGHAHLVMDTAGMPLLLKNIFARAVLAAGPSKL